MPNHCKDCKKTLEQLTADVKEITDALTSHSAIINEIRDTLVPGIEQGFVKHKDRVDKLVDALNEQVDPIIKDFPKVTTAMTPMIADWPKITSELTVINDKLAAIPVVKLGAETEILKNQMEKMTAQFQRLEANTVSLCPWLQAVR